MTHTEDYDETRTAAASVTQGYKRTLKNLGEQAGAENMVFYCECGSKHCDCDDTPNTPEQRAKSQTQRQTIFLLLKGPNLCQTSKEPLIWPWRPTPYKNCLLRTVCVCLPCGLGSKQPLRLPLTAMMRRLRETSTMQICGATSLTLFVAWN